MKVLLLFSGGIDSTVLAHLALEQGHELVPFFIDYAQPAIREERKACRWWCDEHGVQLAQARLTLLGVAAAMATGKGESGPRVVPYRNMIMAAHALSAAAFHGCNEVWLGATKSDHDAYPDCRAEWVAWMNGAARMEGIAVKAPLVDMTKKRVLETAGRLDVVLRRTWSCYQPHQFAVPCGTCDACDACKDRP